MIICCDCFCLSEWNISETTRPIVMHFIFYYFSKSVKIIKFLSNLSSKLRNLREGIFAFIIIYHKFFIIRNISSTFCTEIMKHVKCFRKIPYFKLFKRCRRMRKATDENIIRRMSLCVGYQKVQTLNQNI